jgi:hypothetical protein
VYFSFTLNIYNRVKDILNIRKVCYYQIIQNSLPGCEGNKMFEKMVPRKLRVSNRAITGNGICLQFVNILLY